LNKLGFSPQYHQLDIDDEASIITFRDYLQVTYGGLDVLVNNAAIMFHKTDKEPFGNQAELTIRTNFFSTLKTCQVLFPILRSHARVVNISSSAGHLSRISGCDPAATNLKQKLAAKGIATEELCHLLQAYISAAKTGDHGKLGWPNNNDCYVVSKMALCVLTRIQQREFDADSRNIVVNSVHPGYVNTDMSRHKGIMSPDRGALAPCWLALLPPNVDKPKGDFVWHDQQIIDWVNGPTPSYY